MKTTVHDMLFPMANGIPDAVNVCVSEVDDLGRQLPYVRLQVRLTAEEQAAITEIRKRAKRILERRTDAAKAVVAADPAATVSLDAPVAGEAAEMGA